MDSSNRNVRMLAVLVAVAFVASHCARSKSDATVVSAGAVPAPAHRSTVAPAMATGGPAAGSPLPTSANLITATFKVTVKSLGIPICNGHVAMSVNVSFGAEHKQPLLQVPSGSVDCSVLGTIDVAQLLGAFSTSPPPGADPMIVEDDIVIAFKSMGAATYDPPRPLLPSFFAANAAALAALDFVQPNITVTTATETDSGTVAIKMKSYDQKVTAPVINLTLPHVMDFVITDTGFNKIDKVGNFMFDSSEFVINSVPLAIVSLSLTGAMKYLSIAVGNVQGSAKGPISTLSKGIAKSPDSPIGAATNLIPVTLEMQLESQEGLAEQLAADDTAKSDIGEAIGGKPVAK